MATFKLTPDTGEVSGTHSDMPLVVIPSELEIGTLSTAEAESIRFYSDASLSTELPREVVSADEIHVKVSSVSSSTEIWADYDGVRSDYAVTDTYGRNAVWSGYALVWHGGLTVDASGNLTLTAKDGLAVGGETGKFGEATNFDGVNDYLDPSNFVEDSETFYFSTWFNADTDHKGSLFSITSQLHLAYETNENVEFSFWDGDADSYLDTVSLVPNSTWHFVSAIRDKSSGMKLLLNGVSEASNSETGNPNSSTQINRIGLRSRSNDNEPFDGRMQESRVLKTIPSDDWISTEHNNQNDNAAFWVATEAETVTASPIAHILQMI